MSYEELPPEVEDEMIEKTARRIKEWGLDAPGLLLLESMKPLSYIAGQLSRVFLWPWLPIFGPATEKEVSRFINVFEKRENVEKLITRLEQLVDISAGDKAERKTEGGLLKSMKTWNRK